MQLQNKVAVIYGAGGAVGAAVARAFAREGARLFLSDRRLEPLTIVAKEISAAGGGVETSLVDAIDESAVDRHLAHVVETCGGVDISFSAIGIPNTDLQGTPLVELPLANFFRPVETYAKAHFITARLGARRMLAKKSGTILTITAQPGRRGTPLVGGMAPAWGAIEAFTRSLSAELAPQGIRAVCIRSPGMPETETIHEVFAIHAKAHGMPPARFGELIAQQSNLGRLPTLTELANVAAFVASDRASALTGTVVNLTAGGVAD